MAVLSDLRVCVLAGDWEGAARLAARLEPGSAEGLDEYRRELEALLEIARAGRRELGTSLARVRAAGGFARQGFGVPPQF